MESINGLLSASASIASDALSIASQYLPERKVNPPQSASVQASQFQLDAAMPLIHNNLGLVRVAGLCGAAAVIAGAYGSHVVRERSDFPAKQRIAFETGNRYHMIHSLALLATPLCRYPKLSGALFFAGTLVFSGCCYHYALTGEDTLRKATPFGGLTLILAWLSLVL